MILAVCQDHHKTQGIFPGEEDEELESEDDEWDDEGAEYLTKLEEFVPGDMSGISRKLVHILSEFKGTLWSTILRLKLEGPSRFVNDISFCLTCTEKVY